ncbi:uncharacterized protein E0L32_009275 [Thyridium curvatum]|uniref:Chromo domain-containing protein n=1 Tax=Thyridium curvatum TaxID=1093900 RepID=A0A507AJF2_9PEZI|nr:uncharacterized protein E0L32_009275 [Thyridium curvatum]TPX09532.1 hypothetical protein E0L32_009275 [Thyridium curvatum]
MADPNSSAHGPLQSQDEISAQSDLEDDISITSTIFEEPGEDDTEYVVEDIMAERLIDGEMKYLVYWSGFPKHEWTWEPDSNLGPELRSIWEEDKKKHATGEKPKFDVKEYEDAIAAAHNAAEDAREARHDRRNEKRKRLGLPSTSFVRDPLPSMDSAMVNQHSSSSDEAIEHDTVDDSHAEASTLNKPRQKTFKGIPEPHSNKSTSEKPRAFISRSPNETGTSQRQTAHQPAAPTIGRVHPQKASPAASTAGHQGTAAKPVQSQFARRFAGGNIVKHSSQHPKPKPAESSPMPSSRPNTGKNFTARKSVTILGNAFVDGKRVARRKKLDENMLDPAKEPKMFPNFRRVRQAELRERNLNDRAPDISQIQDKVFEISKGPEPRKTQAAIATSATCKQVNTDSVHHNGDKQTQKKTRKSVSFAVVEEDVDKTAIDNSANRSTTSDTASAEAESPLHSFVSRKAQEPRAQPQRVEKHIKLGRQDARELVVTFDGTVADDSQGWSVSFLRESCLLFGHSVFAQSFLDQQMSFHHTTLGEGTITSDKHPLLLDGIVGRLIAEHAGLYLSRPDYNILLYPGSCAEWESAKIGTITSATERPVLRYVIFSSHFDCGPFLRSSPIAGQPTKAMASEGGRRELMKDIFGLKADDFNRMVSPSSSAPVDGPRIYLAFSPSQIELLKQVGWWFRECAPTSHILSTSQSGSWTAFALMATEQQATIIVHAEVLGAIRRFPNIAQLLQSQLQHQIWCLNESIEDTSRPSIVGLTQLFPCGTAVLVTPSFIVTEPRRAYELFDWFIRRIRNKESAPFKLVTASGISDYLESLAFEKASRREELLRTLAARAEADRENAAYQEGLSVKECEARLKTWRLVSDKVMWHDVSHPLDRYGDDHFFVYADECIDPNDEQSLVNWFGYWSMSRLDQFRNFHVVGSSHSIKKERPKRARRMVPIPTYTKVSTSDPNEYLKRLDVFSSLSLDAMATDDGPTASSQILGAHGQNESRNSLRSGTLHQSQRFPGEDVKDLRQFLWGQVSLCKKQMQLYAVPILWADPQEAANQPYKDTNKKTIQDWFAFGDPFNRQYDTYVGLFYTVADEWNPDDAAPGQRPTRCPWLGIWRPVGAQKKNSCSELFIWDVKAPSKVPKSASAVREEDLSTAQRKVLDYIRAHGEEKKGPAAKLDKVWLGGYDVPQRFANDLDTTIDVLRNHLIPNLFSFLPPLPELILKKGFRRVLRSSEEMPVETGDAEAEQPAVDCEDKSSKIVFHPPQGQSNASIAPRSRNRLHTRVQYVRGRDPAAQTFAYEYLPTMAWYEEQKAQGCGFEHINVNEWEQVFAALEVRKN